MDIAEKTTAAAELSLWLCKPVEVRKVGDSPAYVLHLEEAEVSISGFIVADLLDAQYCLGCSAWLIRIKSSNPNISYYREIRADFSNHESLTGWGLGLEKDYVFDESVSENVCFAIMYIWKELFIRASEKYGPILGAQVANLVLLHNPGTIFYERLINMEVADLVYRKLKVCGADKALLEMSDTIASFFAVYPLKFLDSLEFDCVRYLDDSFMVTASRGRKRKGNFMFKFYRHNFVGRMMEVLVTDKFSCSHNHFSCEDLTDIEFYGTNVARRHRIEF